MLCDNAYKKGSGRGIGGVYPQCLDNKATKVVTVLYGHRKDRDGDDLYLCAECLKALKVDARKYGNTVLAKGV